MQDNPIPTQFPKEYRDLDPNPLTDQGVNSLNLNTTLADFRSTYNFQQK